MVHRIYEMETDLRLFPTSLGTRLGETNMMWYSPQTCCQRGEHSLAATCGSTRYCRCAHTSECRLALSTPRQGSTPHSVQLKPGRYSAGVASGTRYDMAEEQLMEIRRQIVNDPSSCCARIWSSELPQHQSVPFSYIINFRRSHAYS